MRFEQTCFLFFLFLVIDQYNVSEEKKTKDAEKTPVVELKKEKSIKTQKGKIILNKKGLKSEFGEDSMKML